MCASQGAGFSVPVNVAKDFLEANGLLELLPVARLRPGIRHTLDWKGVAIELPDGYRTSRRRGRWAGGEIGEIGFRAYRLATSWPAAGLEEVILGGGEVPGFVPAPASAGRRQAPRKRAAVALPAGEPPSVVASAAGTDPSGRPFRVEYAIVDRKKEKVVARYLGPADAVAFNLGLIRRSLESLEAAQMLLPIPPRPLVAGRPGFESVSFPGGRGASPGPGGLASGAGRSSPCGRLPPPENGLAASHPNDFTLVLRALRWRTTGTGLDEAVRACGQGRGAGAGARRPGRRGTPGGSSAWACRSRPVLVSFSAGPRACSWSWRRPSRSCPSSRASTTAGSGGRRGALILALPSRGDPGDTPSLTIPTAGLHHWSRLVKMPKTVNLYEAKTHLSALVERAYQGRGGRDRQGGGAQGQAGAALPAGEAPQAGRVEGPGRDLSRLRRSSPEEILGAFEGRR